MGWVERDEVMSAADMKLAIGIRAFQMASVTEEKLKHYTPPGCDRFIRRLHMVGKFDLGDPTNFRYCGNFTRIIRKYIMGHRDTDEAWKKVKLEEMLDQYEEIISPLQNPLGGLYSARVQVTPAQIKKLRSLMVNGKETFAGVISALDESIAHMNSIVRLIQAVPPEMLKDALSVFDGDAKDSIHQSDIRFTKQLMKSEGYSEEEIAEAEKDIPNRFTGDKSDVLIYFSDALKDMQSVYAVLKKMSDDFSLYIVPALETQRVR